MERPRRRIRKFLGLVFLIIVTLHYVIVTFSSPFLDYDLITNIIKPEIRNCIGIFKENAKRSVTNYIVVHHDSIEKVTNSILAINDYHISKGFGTIAYHYYIDKSGIVYQLHDENTITPHARQYNVESVSICLSGNFESEYLEHKQERSLKRLLFYLKLKYRNAKIVKHGDLIPTKCCGKNVNLKEIVRNVESYIVYP